MRRRGIGRPLHKGDLWWGICFACLCLLVPAVALAANPNFPGTDPAESPRINTPDDPDFDSCEEDNEEGPQTCTSYFGAEEYRAFGFSPDTANATPDPTQSVPHYADGTRYADCNLPNPQLDAQGRAANLAAEADDTMGNPVAEALAECLMIAGIRSDTAWKYSTGSPDTQIAILDTGIRWQEPELKNKVALNQDELPIPLWDRGGDPLEGAPCGGAAPNPGNHDADGNGAFNVLDYRCDSGVSKNDGEEEADCPPPASRPCLLDASDLIGAFSDGFDGLGADNENNNFVDDIAGWDFFDDDNDPFDASSCCSANGHGTGRAREAVAETNNADGGVGHCPECQVVPLRVWDTFVVPIDNYAMAVVYAADNGVEVVEGAVGGLGNTQFARRAFEYADSKGLALMMVSSDINSANHNYPTNYNEAIYVAGSVPDTAPVEGCNGPGSIPFVGDAFDDNDPGFQEGCEAFIEALGDGSGCPGSPQCVAPSAQPLTTTMFRNSNLTQYGGKADIVLMGSTGSENTGQSSGAAGLLASYGREQLDGTGVGDCHAGTEPDSLSGNEIRQLLTMTAEDVKPLNTGTIGSPDKANDGWDPHFGYGRVNLAGAMKRIDDCTIPPEAQIDSPDWFAPINVDRIGAGGLPVTGRAASPHGSVAAWELEYTCGQDAADSTFLDVPGANGTSAVDGPLGSIPKATLETLADTCNGEVLADAGRPAGTSTDPWPANPYPNPDPERHAVQIRLTVTDASGATNIGRYRKTLQIYNDDGNLPDWPRPVGAGSVAADHVTGSGGEVSPRLYDLDGDNALDVIQATTSGEIYALHADGSPVTSFNGGQPVRTDRYALELNHPVPVDDLPRPRETLRVPALGDIDDDREVEIVASAGEHVYAWNLDGSRTAGFPVRIDPDLSEPCTVPRPEPCFSASQRLITSENHIKRGIFGSPALADLDCDGSLDVVSGSMDQHLYAWDGDGEELDGFPKKLESDGAVGAEIITSPAIAELDGNGCGDADGDGGSPEVVIATNEVVELDCFTFPPPEECNPEFPGSFLGLTNVLLQIGTGANPVYAVHGDGSDVDGWPVSVGIAAGDLLPLVLPSHDQAVVDRDDDGTDEVSVSAATSVQPGGTRLVNGDGSNAIPAYEAQAANSQDQSAILNLADYQSVGDILGGGTPGVFKGGLTANGAANLLAVNQNLPFSHVQQGWDVTTGEALPGYPVATDDFQLLSQASIAQVAGPGPARQVLVGTGMYNLHAYGPGGVDLPGWPKFTGGWQQATPAVGDADGDGDLEVTTLTREGWSFLWNTDDPSPLTDGVAACGDTNNEWWTFHHDEHSSNNYGNDGRPPGTPEDFQRVRGQDGSLAMDWIAPGDDWLCNDNEDPLLYRVIGSDDPIDEPIEHPSDGTLIKEQASTADPGQRQALAPDLTAAEVGTYNHVAVLYRDDNGNWGLLASTTVPGVGGGPTDTDMDTINDDVDNCPLDPNTDQADADMDGTGDVCEPPPDADGDGAPDATDNCPATPNPGQEDGDGDGKGDLCDPAGGPGGGENPAAAPCSTAKVGTGGRDTLTGTTGSDRITGLKGNDRINGLAGDDCLFGNKGADRVNGGAGADQISGGNKRDRVIGGPGRDTIRAGNAGDVVKAKDGEADTIDCGGGVDRVKADPQDKLINCEPPGANNRRKPARKRE